MGEKIASSANPINYVDYEIKNVFGDGKIAKALIRTDGMREVVVSNIQRIMPMVARRVDA